MRRLVAVLAVSLAAAAAALSPDLERALRESKYVYVQSERKSGELGKPAEIWFHWDGKAVWVGTPPTAWRVRRIKAGRILDLAGTGRWEGDLSEMRGDLESRERRAPDGSRSRGRTRAAR